MEPLPGAQLDGTGLRVCWCLTHPPGRCAAAAGAVANPSVACHRAHRLTQISTLQSGRKFSAKAASQAPAKDAMESDSMKDPVFIIPDPSEMNDVAAAQHPQPLMNPPSPPRGGLGNVGSTGNIDVVSSIIPSSIIPFSCQIKVSAAKMNMLKRRI